MKKILSTLNMLLIAIAIIISFYLVITKDKQIGVILKDISIVVTITAPYWFEKIFHKKLPIILKFICILFIFSAHFVGAILKLYNHLYFYDKIIHFLSGVLTAALSIYFMKEIDFHQNKWVSILFMISLTLAVAAMWEIFEYTANLIVGGDAQRVAATGVNDTMQDIIVAFLGSLFPALYYLFQKES